MIARNHERIFNTLSADLAVALERAGVGGGAHPYALYLGNWMADFSQLCSPDIPNMLIDLLDLPDLMRRLSADGLAFLDAQQKALPAAIAAAVAGASRDKPALARTAAKLKSSPWQSEELLRSYQDYLQATPSPLTTAEPEPAKASSRHGVELARAPTLAQQAEQKEKRKREHALSVLQGIAARSVRAGENPSGAPPGAETLVTALVLFILGPLFEGLRDLLKGVRQAADAVDIVYKALVEYLEAVGFVDRFNGACELAVWLLGLFKFSNPADADLSLAPGKASPAPGPSLADALRAAPSYLPTPRAFVAPPSAAAAPRAAGHIPPSLYSGLFARHFGFYKPYEHLDRFMDSKKVAAATGGGGPERKRTLAQKRDFRNYRKDNYARIVTPIASLKTKGIDLDGTLWTGLQIAFGRLLELREEEGRKLEINERLLLAGRSFHAFEDYFAHTNFVDRLIYSMQLEHGFDSHPFELKKILLSVASEDAFTALKAKPGLFAHVDCANPTVRKIIEAGASECVKSGYYDTPDTIHSLVHLLEGRIRDALDMEDDERDSRFDLYDALEAYARHKLEEIEKAGPAAFESGKNGLTALLIADPDDLFLDEKSFAKIVSSNPLLKSMGSSAGGLRRLVNAIFWLILAYHSAKQAKDAYVAVRSALKIFITLVRILKALFLTPNVLLRYVKIAFAVVPDWVRDEVLALAVEAFKELVRSLASILLGWIDKMLENKVRYGSHSLMAKDEAHDQRRLYALAEQFGILIGKAALEFVFPEAPEEDASPPPASPATKSPREVLECLLDGFAYNPLTLERDPLVCVSRGLFTRFTLYKPGRNLDRFLKESAGAYVAEDMAFKDVPGFVLWLAGATAKERLANAMRMMARLNADQVVLVAGNDKLHLTDATFRLLRPAEEIEIVAFKTAQTHALEGAPTEIPVRPWPVKFAGDFVAGKAVDWKDYDLAELSKVAPSGHRGLPGDYRALAGQLIGDYSQIWRNILIVPGKLGDSEWAVSRENGAPGWL